MRSYDVRMFESLDYLYIPTSDVDGVTRTYVEQLGAELVFKVRGMGTTVACVRLSQAGPALLLTGHLEGPEPVAVYRVTDYASALEALRQAGATDIHQLEIPQGPCASMRAHGGLRLAIYELVRPGVIESFTGRVDD